MQHETLLLSVRPTFAERIIEGTKTAELRRVRPAVRVGQSVLIYGSSPMMALLASAVVERVDAASPEALWGRVRNAAGVTKAEYVAYFAGAANACAIWLGDVTAFEQAIPLRRLRERWPWFRPPQSYCYVRATFEAPSSVTSLAPRSDA
jgi:predicted transcriptional regulator